MPIYWSQKSLPALQGLSAAEAAAAKRTVIRNVWRHWQVWLPFFSLALFYLVFLLVAPQFPYRIIVVSLTAIALAKVASLPFNSYLQHYLETRRNEL